MTMAFLSNLAKVSIFYFELATRDLSFLQSCAKSSLLKSKSLISVGSISFLHDSYSFTELVHDGCVKPVPTTASTRNIEAATWLHVSPMPVIQSQWYQRILADISKLSKVISNESLSNLNFLYSSFRMHKLLQVRLWYDSGCNQPDFCFWIFIVIQVFATKLWR